MFDEKNVNELVKYKIDRQIVSAWLRELRDKLKSEYNKRIMGYAIDLLLEDVSLADQKLEETNK